MFRSLVALPFSYSEKHSVHGHPRTIHPSLAGASLSDLATLVVLNANLFITSGKSVVSFESNYGKLNRFWR